MPDKVDYNLWNLDAKNTIPYMGVIMALTPFSDDIFRIVTCIDVSNDNLSFQMVKRFNMQGIKKLDRVKYKLPINVEESEDPCILLDLLWKSKQLTASNTKLWSGTMKSVFGKPEEKV